jgi:cytochrome d ubiquinol oxidase subunit II
MGTLWFCIVAVMVALYVVLDGFDLGAGALHLFIGKNDEERRTIIRAIGPVWDGNEVWLLAGGGALYLAFPQLYASGFSGFYLPLMMVLWLLMLRAIGIEFRSHLQAGVWRSFFDGIFGLSSILLCIFFGAALGNVIRGVPLRQDGYFFEPLWTNWRVGAENGILDWYTVMCGVVALITLSVHGAHYLAVKTEGQLQQRARFVSALLWPLVVVQTGISLVLTLWIRPELITNYNKLKLGYLIPLIVVASVALMWNRRAKGDDKGAFLASSVYIVVMLVGAVYALYPTILPASTNVDYSLTIANSVTSDYALRVALVWWSIGIVLAAGYFVFIYRMFRGKVNLADGGEYGH